MNTFLMFALVIMTLLDGCIKYRLSTNGMDTNFITETIVNKIGWLGYFVILIIILGVIALFDSIVLNFILIAILAGFLTKQIRGLKAY